MTIDAHSPRNVSVKFNKLHLAEYNEDKALELEPKIRRIENLDERNKLGQELERRVVRQRELAECVVVGGTLQVSLVTPAGRRIWSGTVEAVGTSPDRAHCKLLEQEVLNEHAAE